MNRIPVPLRSTLISLLCMPSFLGATSASLAQTTPERFDHDATSFPLTGRHASTSCEGCHPNGAFEGTPTRCNLCHAPGNARAETRPSSGHVPIQTSCGDCHTTLFWEPARMDHATVSAECASCHVGRMARSKPLDHIQSSNDCAACHGTLTWEGARFDHDAIVDGCVTCHDGRRATGKGTGHVPSGNQCELCHSTRRWSPATRFDHTGIVDGCVGCHDGRTAPGKSRDHPPSSNDCQVCHSTNAWTPAGFDHADVMPGTCNGCHDGSTAEGQPTGHFSTLLSCDRCHTTNAWLPASFDHAGTAYPGDHRVALGCTDCHGGRSAVVTWSAPAYQPDCAGCHAGDYRTGPHEGRSVSQNRDCAGTCHQPSPEHSVRSREW